MAEIKKYKTWVEINKFNLRCNIGVFRSILGKKTELWSVVKSNAYGHGLLDFSVLADKCGVDGFCVDSVLEGLTLRKAGIKKDILVLGPTLPDLLPLALENNITITISNFDALKQLVNFGKPVGFHLKIDTGMRRQGFLPNDLKKAIGEFRISNFEFLNYLKGAYTHFASAKDLNYPTFTDLQFDNFKKGVAILKKTGLKKIKVHAAATGGTLMGKKYHLDAVRLGIGLYGLWPSRELEMQCCDFKIKPVLSWRAAISEIKNFKKGDFIGYDLTERARKNGKLAIIPIGYWHGFARGLSGPPGGGGEVLIKGKRARVLGRVSMDIIAVDATGINCDYGDPVTIIGGEGNDYISANELAAKTGTVHYEIITRINPLIKRLIK